ncbi:MAG: GTP 3',8-cyclase MoaA [Gammaproteobacteria bacterium]|nr:GTP 3',8-cyclase MoaA [Gammaproteobacteria bacterium]
MSDNNQPTDTSTNNDPDLLIDRFGRKVTYLRMSVTDRCDLRCVYCMSEDMKFVPRSQLLTLEEIIRIGTTASELGVNKIRITGGEPLTRNNIMKVFYALGELDQITDLTLTTNGTQLVKYAHELKQAGVTRINISLDTLHTDRFKNLTRVGVLSKTLDGIDAAINQGFNKVKINAVIMKNRNHEECSDLVQFAIDRNIDISFIEEMPLGIIDEHDRGEVYYSSDDILSDLQQNYTLNPSMEKTGGPSKYYAIAGSSSRVGFISPHSHNFCDQCNRVRLTAEGRLLLCLGQEHSVDLRSVVRANPLDNNKLRKALIDSMAIKPKGHDFNINGQPVILRHMNTTGG